MGKRAAAEGWWAAEAAAVEEGGGWGRAPGAGPQHVGGGVAAATSNAALHGWSSTVHMSALGCVSIPRIGRIALCLYGD